MKTLTAANIFFPSGEGQWTTTYYAFMTCDTNSPRELAFCEKRCFPHHRDGVSSGPFTQGHGLVPDMLLQTSGECASNFFHINFTCFGTNQLLDLRLDEIVGRSLSYLLDSFVCHAFEVTYFFSLL